MCKLANCIDYNESTVINTAIRNIALHVRIHACSLEGTFLIACRIDYIVLRPKYYSSCSRESLWQCRGATRQQCWALHPPQTLFTFNYGADTAVPLALPTSKFLLFTYIKRYKLSTIGLLTCKVIKYYIILIRCIKLCYKFRHYKVCMYTIYQDHGTLVQISSALMHTHAVQ